MVRAYPIDNEGNKIGKIRRFSDQQWSKMNKMFGSKIRFKVAEKGQTDRVKGVELVSTKQATSKRTKTTKKNK